MVVRCIRRSSVVLAIARRSSRPRRRTGTAATGTRSAEPGPRSWPCRSLSEKSA
jgi:hypothetical protein